MTEPASALPPAVPPMLRTPMAPQPWGRVGPVSWMLRRLFGLDPRLPDIEGPAHGAGRRRRFVLLTLSLLPALYATYVLDGLLPNVVTANETVNLAIAWGETALLIVFALLTCWLAAGFWTAMLGFFVLVDRRRPAVDFAFGEGGRRSRHRRAPRLSCRSATKTCAVCSQAYALPTNR